MKACLVCGESACRAMLCIDGQQFPLCLIHQSFVENAIATFIVGYKRREVKREDAVEAITLVKSYKGRYHQFETDLAQFKNRQESVRTFVAQSKKAPLYK